MEFPIGQRNNVCVHEGFQVLTKYKHNYPCVSSEHSPPLPPHNTHIHKKKQVNMFICLTSDVYRYEL